MSDDPHSRRWSPVQCKSDSSPWQIPMLNVHVKIFLCWDTESSGTSSCSSAVTSSSTRLKGSRTRPAGAVCWVLIRIILKILKMTLRTAKLNTTEHAASRNLQLRFSGFHHHGWSLGTDVGSCDLKGFLLCWRVLRRQGLHVSVHVWSAKEWFTVEKVYLWPKTSIISDVYDMMWFYLEEKCTRHEKKKEW